MLLLAPGFGYQDFQLVELFSNLVVTQKLDSRRENGSFSRIQDGGAGVDTKHYTTEFVFNAFLENLKSPGLRREFFESLCFEIFETAAVLNLIANIYRIC